MIVRLDIPPGQDNPSGREEILRRGLPVARRGEAIVVAGEVAGPPGLVVFDLDGTLSACEFVDAIAVRRGLGHLTRELTARAMNGEMDFSDSYTRRLEILAGTPLELVESVIRELTLAPGAAETITALKSAGVPTAIITGGYARPARAIKERLGVDFLCATELEEQGGCMTGRLAGPLLDEWGKAAALGELCAHLGIEPARAVAVGDGANDLKMLATAGLAVLYTSLPADERPALRMDLVLDFLL
ncbi:MAG: phosphoserine phosphatase SerB [Alistipes sp.]|jgi:phosphoserine phosphatase|nr:phosphoserine phosphatase SerB [Alistipes sp.]